MRGFSMVMWMNSSKFIMSGRIAAAQLKANLALRFQIPTQVSLHGIQKIHRLHALQALPTLALDPRHSTLILFLVTFHES